MTRARITTAGVALAALALATLSAPATSGDHTGHGKNIVETAAAAGQFETLAAALEAAGLVDTLQAEGPFTVFAPTDEAFARLPEGTVSELLKPENRDKLTAILTYHVVPGKVISGKVVDLNEAGTVNGKMIAIAVDGGSVKINDATVVKADVETSNGVIHVIDRVLLP